ncbi:hypothetical protein [Desulfovibrio ferrophilus]|nr:hypothetical protein [Desulfovibrio ferrophilus]
MKEIDADTIEEAQRVAELLLKSADWSGITICGHDVLGEFFPMSSMSLRVKPDGHGWTQRVEEEEFQEAKGSVWNLLKPQIQARAREGRKGIKLQPFPGGDTES